MKKSLIKKVGFLASILWICHQGFAALVPVGKGAYETTLPAGQKGPSDQNGNRVHPKTTSTFALPPKTNSWWTSLIYPNDPAQQWSQNLFAHPLAFRAKQNGLGVSYPSNFFVSPYVTAGKGQKIHEFHYPYAEDFVVSVAGLSAPSTQVADYSDWSVTALWQGNGKTLNATIGKGFPYAYFTTAGDAAQILFTATPNIWYNTGGIIGVTVNGHHYGIFAPEGSTWTGTQTLSSTLSGKNYFSVAVLPDNTAQTLDFYRIHAYAFPTSTAVQWTYNPSAGQLTSLYTVQTTLKETGNNHVNQPLLALYRHQWLHTSTPVTSYGYVSARGAMKVVNGSSFTTTLPVTGVLPELPLVAKDGTDTFSTSELYGYVDAIYRQSPTERWNGLTVGDTYWVGKALGKIAHLIQVANQVNHSAAKSLFLAELKARLEDWFDGKNPQLFYYDTEWKTLIGYPASFGSDTQLNDHHFHYGYFLMAAATVAQYDPTWALPSAWGGMVETLIKDVSNWDKKDSRFPFLRSFDVYEGHCWASGPAMFAAGNNEESSSESMNYSSALILWGALTNNPTLRDLGIFLYQTEASSIEQYWFNLDKAVFPAGFVEPTVGMVWGDGGAYTIWWDGSVEELHGINFIPIQGGSLYLGRYPDYLRINQDFMKGNAGGSGTWRDIHMSVKALYAPKDAITEFNANRGYAPEAGESKAHTYSWIHNLNRLGRIAPQITADIPTAAAFNSGSSLSYVGFNPTSNPIVVHFSDGAQLAVPPLTTASSLGQPVPPPADHGFIQGIADINGGSVRFSFKPNQPIQSVQVAYQINSGSSKTLGLTQGSSDWFGTVSGLSNQDKISYTFTFTQGGSQYKSDTYQHTYQSTTVPPDSNFTQKVEELSNGRLEFTFIPKTASTFVDLHYKINKGGQLNVRMTNNNGTWSYIAFGLNKGDLVDYSFTYFTDAGHDTEGFQHTYGGDAPPLPPVPEEDFQQKVETITSNRVLVTFTPFNAQQFVILNYQIGTQKANRLLMSRFGSSWIASIPSLNNGDKMTYSFSYYAENSTKDSPNFTYDYVAPIVPVTAPKAKKK